MEIHAPTEALSLFAFHLAQEMLEETELSRALTVTSEKTETGFVAHAVSGDLSVTEKAELSEHFTEQRCEHVACGKALFSLFEKMSHLHTPYGTLVGVRPVKIALFYRERGVSSANTEALLVRDYRLTKAKAKLITELSDLELITDRSLSENDAMLYLSIPFCPSRCRYCSFVSHSAPKQLSLLPDYLARMKEELSECAELFQKTSRRLRAVYLGGGTPGLLSAEELTDLFETVKNTFPRALDTEFTAELGRPDTITAEKCIALKESGVGRICINPQTLSDRVLEENGRAHTKAQFLEAFESARHAGIPIINTDLIAGLYGDTPENFSASLAEILALSPENLTIHALCKKRSSEEESLPQKDADMRWSDTMQVAFEACINHDYVPYYLYRQKNTVANLENLGYAKPNTACLYNIAMMEDLCDVFAVGAGAMTKLRTATADGGYQMVRLPSYKYPAEYLSNPEKGRQNRLRAERILLS